MTTMEKRVEIIFEAMLASQFFEIYVVPLDTLEIRHVVA